MKKIHFIIAIAFFVVLSSSGFCQARTNVTDWYIKDFQSDIQVEKNSALLVTERITADCGNAPNKHGIFRILPTQIKFEDGSVTETPIELIGITDENNNALKYAETYSSSDKTITWKIGDPNRTVTGVNYYNIQYRVYNTIRFANSDFDELYWNLNGNFWDLETDNFRATIHFPVEVSESNSQIFSYAGATGSKSTDLVNFSWTVPNVLEFQSTKMIPARQGITASVTFPKGIFTAYLPADLIRKKQSTNLSVNWNYIIGFPLIALIVFFFFWLYRGKDPAEPKTVIAEYDPPAGLSPSEMDVLTHNGNLQSAGLTAEIINLAVLGAIKIKEIENKIWIFSSKDYEFSKVENFSDSKLNESQKEIVRSLFSFGSGNVVLISQLRNKFSPNIKEIQKKTQEALEGKSLVLEYSLKNKKTVGGISAALFVLGFVFSQMGFFGPGFGLLISGFVAVVFSQLMTKKTLQGAEIDWKIKGFKLFMKTAEKYRSEFQEKENIFEKLLPYAIAFGLTKLWIQKMKDIYGDDFFSHYAPAWYAGNLAGGTFDVNSFSSSMSSLSSAIGSNVSSTSGSGGSGGAGGGGGGGGGGGW
jgi:uncharacterized membrane protein